MKNVTFANLLTFIANNWSEHASNTNWYRETESHVRNLISKSTDSQSTFFNLESVGTLSIPLFKMGNISSLHLFGLDELIIFSLYRQISRRGIALDLGANIGVHSIVLDRLGYKIQAFEPDPIHSRQLEKNLQINSVNNTSLNLSAVSTSNGESEFTRVSDNTTGSHLSGATGKNPYGPIDKFYVKTISLNEILAAFQDVKLIKMDVEGFEANLINALDPAIFKQLTLILEVGNEKNAEEIFKYIKRNNLFSYSQKNGWKIVKSLDDIPKSHKTGSLVIPKQGKPLAITGRLHYWP